MRIALLGDIHSNQFAFQAVLSDLSNQNINKIYFMGDYAFGGSGSIECVDILRKLDFAPYIAIQGNKEDYIKDIETGKKNLHPILPFIYNELGPERINFLKSLPETAVDIVENIKINLRHNPAKDKVFIIQDRLNRQNSTPNLETLEQLQANLIEDICIFGHYHLFMDETVLNKRFICTGSVGLPYGDDYKATYMILDIKNGNVKTEKKYVEYDRSKLIDDFEKIPQCTVLLFS
jgi:putative phosphoesterase